jgi:protein kinase
MHHQGYFYRDLKPKNLLVTKDVIKIVDLGLAREVFSAPPYTKYVSTRWYRAPEVFLQSPYYNSATDMWAMGAIMSELFTLQPLFPSSREVDEIYKICSAIGTPDHQTWTEGMRLATSMNYQDNTIDPYAFMNERCPSLPPVYNRPPRRRVLLVEIVSYLDCTYMMRISKI